MVSRCCLTVIAGRAADSRTQKDHRLKTHFIIPVFLLLGAAATAQKTNADIRKGNLLYKQKNYEGSKEAYNKALTDNPNNPTANYNLGNANYRSDKRDEAIQQYDNTIGNSTGKPVREKAYYNKGVALSKDKKLPESIEAWKESLKLDPNDNDARENLQKALIELKKQQQQQQQNKDKKEDKKKDQQKQPKEQQQQQQQPQSKLNKQQVEQLLKALQQKEKEIQQKMQKGTASPNKPEKDW